MKECWIFNEPGHPVVNELLAKGRELAEKAGMKLCLITVDLPDFQNDHFVEALYPLIKEREPEIFLFGATSSGKTLAPSLAAQLETGLTADCTELEIDPESGILSMIRPAYGGHVMATVLCNKNRPQMATVQVGAFESASVEFEEIKIKPDISEFRNRMKKFQTLEKSPSSHLHEAEFVVTGGRGLGSAENFHYVEELAEVLGGAVGASKAVVDIGWKQHEHQIGLSGISVSPMVYIACGVSGAIQHGEGIKNADIVVAINSDPAAPIFDYADIGLVGDVFEVVPELIRQLKRKRV